MPIIFFLAGLVIGLPLLYVIGGTGFIHALTLGEAELLAMVPQRCFAAVNSFSLMAIPLFVLAGELMSYGGIMEKLTDMMRALVGHIKGGMAYTTVLVGAALGALLGSANASAALLGDVMYPELKKDDYPGDFSASLITGTSVLGPIIPPSMVFVMYGVAAQVSISKLFFGGIIPGVLIVLAFFLVIGVTARKYNFPSREKEPWKHRVMAVAKAAPALLIPLIILGGILTGVTTPTESAATASFVAVLLGVFVYRKLKLKDLPKILERTGVVSATVLVLCAVVNILGWTLALDRIPQAIGNFILSISSNKYVILLIINIFLLLFGMVIDNTAALLLLAPIFIPVVTSVGVDPVHFGIVMSINMCIGLISPPVGGALFTTLVVTKEPSGGVIKWMWPWLLASIVVLLLITYIPGLVMFLPNLL